MYINLRIKVPNIIEYIWLWFLLRYRRRHYGFAFRKIKLITSEKADKNGRYAIINSEDYQKISKYNWQFFESKSKKCYAVRLDNEKIVRMHRVIMNAAKGTIVDHKDHDGLNNRKANLRFATLAENCQNSTKRTKNVTSKYKGVCLSRGHKKWMASITYNGKRKHLGYFENEEEAGRAYDATAKIYHGEFAVLNFETDYAKQRSQKLKKPVGFKPE